MGSKSMPGKPENQDIVLTAEAHRDNFIPNYDFP